MESVPVPFDPCTREAYAAIPIALPFPVLDPSLENREGLPSFCLTSFGRLCSTKGVLVQAIDQIHFEQIQPTFCNLAQLLPTVVDVVDAIGFGFPDAIMSSFCGLTKDLI